MRITVVGCGHVGLVQAVAMAAIGHQVIGIDSSPSRIEQLQEGGSPFHEPGLHEETTRQVNAGRLRFTTDPEKAYSTSNVIFLCVGTPPRADGGANLLAVESAAREISKHAADNTVVVEKSTVPPGTHEKLTEVLGPRLHVASNPEFLREGTALADTMSPSRIVVGASSPIAHARMADVYQALVDTGTRYIATDVATAELSKHASNSMLSLKISFINAIAMLCDETGADVASVADIMGADPRIGRSFLDAGLGFGGFCFPKDVSALSKTFKMAGVDGGSKLLDAVLDVNRQAVWRVYDKLEGYLWHLEGKKIAVLGLAFKPDTDDTRFSPAVSLIKKLLDSGASVTAWDPEVVSLEELPLLDRAASIYDAAYQADAVVIATEWSEIRSLNFERLVDSMRGNLVVDGRNFLTDFQRSSAETMFGLRVVGVGR
jgi:UDPglucose 6-dehydrogenase